MAIESVKKPTLQPEKFENVIFFSEFSELKMIEKKNQKKKNVFFENLNSGIFSEIFFQIFKIGGITVNLLSIHFYSKKILKNHLTHQYPAHTCAQTTLSEKPTIFYQIRRDSIEFRSIDRNFRICTSD